MELKMKQIKKKIGVSMLLLVAVGVLSGGAYYVWLTTPPPMPATMQEAADLLSSTRYQRLPDSRRYDYMQRATQLFENATPEQKKELANQLRKNAKENGLISKVVEDRINMEVRNYIRADDFERRIIIDRTIGLQMLAEARRAKRPAKEMTPERQARVEKRKSAFAAMVEDRLEKGNPQQQSYVGEFVKAVMARRKEMGLEPLPMNHGK